MIVQTSIDDDELAPAEDYKVRANLTAAAWILKPVDGGVKLTYIVSISLAGASLDDRGKTDGPRWHSRDRASRLHCSRAERRR